MSDLAPAISPERTSPWPVVVAWAVILACVGFQMARVARAYKRAAELGAPNPSSELQVRFAGKSAVGMKALTSFATPSRTTTTQPSAANSESLIHSMDQHASSPREKVRAITVVGEVLGVDEALKRIDEMQGKEQPEAISRDLDALRTIYTSGPESLDADAKQRLIDRHGFFGRLANVAGADSNDPDRVKVLHDAKVTAIAATIAGLLVLGLCVVILAAAITAIVLGALGKFRRLYAPQPLANSAYLEAFAIYIVSFMLLSRLMGAIGLESLAWEWLAMLLIPVGMLWVKHRGATAGDVRRGFGWNAGRGPLVEIPLGIFGYLAGVPVVVVGFCISLLLMRYSGASPAHPLQKMLQGGLWHTLNLYGVACILAPILEETMFRGALLHHMRRRWNFIVSSSVVAFIFAAIHPQGWSLIPALGSIAIVLAAIREWRGSLWASIAGHATNNFIVLSLGLIVAR